MKNINCDVCKDLITLYVDNLCSEESKALVEEHMSDCKDCTDTYNAMKENVEIPTLEDKEIKNNEEFKFKSKKLWKRFLLRAFLVLSFIFVLLIGFVVYEIYLAEKFFFKYTEPGDVWTCEDNSISITYCAGEKQRIGLFSYFVEGEVITAKINDVENEFLVHNGPGHAKDLYFVDSENPDNMFKANYEMKDENTLTMKITEDFSDPTEIDKIITVGTEYTFHKTGKDYTLTDVSKEEIVYHHLNLLDTDFFEKNTIEEFYFDIDKNEGEVLAVKIKLNDYDRIDNDLEFCDFVISDDLDYEKSDLDWWNINEDILIHSYYRDNPYTSYSIFSREYCNAYTTEENGEKYVYIYCEGIV